MRTTDEQVNEVFRRAALLRARRLRRKKILLGVCCFALSFHLILLLKGRISMTVATNTATYGSLVFEGIGNHYVLIALAFLDVYKRQGSGRGAWAVYRGRHESKL